MSNMIEQLQKDITKIATDYAGNGASLQEQYAANPDLRRLLALQEEKSRRDAAIRQMKMEAQVPPATVMDQLKQQIVGDMPQEGIVAAARGGMVRGFAEGGEIDLNEAVQTLPFDETVDADLNEAKQNLPFDETVDADPDGVEKLLDSSYEEGTVENPDTGEEVTKVGGGIANWAMDNPVEAVSLGLMFIPGIGWGIAGGIRGLGLAYKGLKGIDYLSKGKNIGQGIVKGSTGLGNLSKRLFTKPGKVTPQNPLKQGPGGKYLKASRQFSPRRTALLGGPLTGGALMGINYFYENGFSDEDIEEAIANGQLTQESGTGATGTGATGTGAPTEPPMSVFEKIMEKFGVSNKDQIDNLDIEGRIERAKARADTKAEINKPEEEDWTDIVQAGLAGAAAYGLGGFGTGVNRKALATKEAKKEYQTMLLDSEEQIDDLAQTLGDKAMAINLTAATNEYARDVAAKALAIDNARDQRDFILKAMETMGAPVGKALTENPFVNAKLMNEGPEAAQKLAGSLRTIFMQSPGYQTLQEILVGMGVSLAGSPSGASSSGGRPLSDFNQKS